MSLIDLPAEEFVLVHECEAYVVIGHGPFICTKFHNFSKTRLAAFIVTVLAMLPSIFIRSLMVLLLLLQLLIL